MITETQSYDVAVVGGGTAGVFAAIAAAKNGARTLLIERNNRPGGTMTAANVNFPGLFFAWGKQIIAGPCWQSIEKTVEYGGAVLPKICYKPEKHWQEQIRLNPFVYTAVLLQMLQEAGVEFLGSTMLCGAEEQEEGVRLTLACKEGIREIFAKKAIDATGDANLCQQAGLPVEKSPVLQPATLQNHLSGYDIRQVDPGEIAEKFETSGLPGHLNGNLIYAYLKNGRFDLHIACGDADTSAGRSRLEEDSLAGLLQLYRFCRGIQGLETLQIDFIAAETGVRETNRIRGLGRVTAEDYIAGTFYPDSVCYAFYPIDLHVMEGIRKTYHADGLVGKVPYSALLPENARHIAVAGRCLSSDTNANSALRVEAVCMATGQAAGCAAALAAKQQIPLPEVPFPQLKESLKAIGAIVPEA